MTMPVPVRADRVEEIFHDQLDVYRRETTRMFAWLMGAQWLGGIIAALVISPRTWIGEQNRVHQHVWLAILVGAALASLPIALAFLAPTRAVTRHVIAVAQMLFSALLIHLTGGRIETHFHVFGSLAFLAFYRDWRVIMTATVVVALDHMIRGIFAPLSVFGTALESPWRWTEHAGWVLFEDIVLVFSCLRGIAEVRRLAERQAGLEQAKVATELEVQERTKELRASNASLSENQSALHAANEGLRAAAAEREALHEKLVRASREAGMAEIATGVLHNVGNVLNSINVSATVVTDKLRDSEVTSLSRACDMMEQRREDLPKFLAEDDKGKLLPGFLIDVSKCLGEEQKVLLTEMESLARGVEHIKHVIQMQQTHAKRRLIAEMVNPVDLMESALQMQTNSALQGIAVDRRFAQLAPMRLDKHRIIQILTNLISNARHALRDGAAAEKRLTLSVELEHANGAPKVCFRVRDNGIGIAADNLARIFALGFTTRDSGHGFGLHSAATAAQEMGGSLVAASDGPGHGAVFTLTVPALARPDEAAPDEPVPAAHDSRDGGETCTAS